MPFCKQKLLPSAVGYSSSSVPAAAIAIELDFVDSCKYNIAAYRLAELLNLDDTLPVYAERKWQGKTGSLNWWLPVEMDDAKRVEKSEPPDPDKWNKRMCRVRFSTIWSKIPIATSPRY